MTQHYPRSTVEASAWCKKCHNDTMHRIDGVKLGPCLVCMAKQDQERQERAARAAAPKPPEQTKLF